MRIALVEDQARTRAGLIALLGREPRFKVVGAWSSMEDALAEVGARRAARAARRHRAARHDRHRGVKRLKELQPGCRS